MQSEKCNFSTFKILCFHLYRSMLQCKESTRITFSFIRLFFPYIVQRYLRWLRALTSFAVKASITNTYNVQCVVSLNRVSLTNLSVQCLYNNSYMYALMNSLAAVVVMSWIWFDGSFSSRASKGYGVSDTSQMAHI